jgi:hypothetical protein
MVIIYSEKPGPRLQYVLDEIFVQRMGIAFELTDKADIYLASTATIKLNYSETDMPGVRIHPHGILSESGIRASNPEELKLPGNFLEPREGVGSDHDILSSTFWYLSRYEEYLPHQRDAHDRFTRNYLENASEIDLQPVLDQALNQFYQHIGLEAKDKFAIYPTIDIDMAFKHKGRGTKRWIGGLLRSLFQGKFSAFIERLAVGFGKKDPYNTFTYLHEQLRPLAANSRFFIQVSEHGKYDKTISLQNKNFAAIVKEIGEHYETGMHPGYESGRSIEGINREKDVLENFLQKKITRSRQHFLRLKLPQTYEHLLAAGITHDYTMGFADHIGFRAGTAHSFRFFNPLENTPSQLVVHPFCLMEVSLKNYMKLDVSQALEYVEKIKSRCRQAGAPFCFIFHNDSLSDNAEWKGWRKVFEACLK